MFAELVKVRWAVMWICREVGGFSYPRIAVAFNRDHTTIMHGVEKADISPVVWEIIEEILEGMEA